MPIPNLKDTSFAQLSGIKCVQFCVQKWARTAKTCGLAGG